MRPPLGAPVPRLPPGGDSPLRVLAGPRAGTPGTCVGPCPRRRVLVTHRSAGHALTAVSAPQAPSLRVTFPLVSFGTHTLLAPAPGARLTRGASPPSSAAARPVPCGPGRRLGALAALRASPGSAPVFEHGEPHSVPRAPWGAHTHRLCCWLHVPPSDCENISGQFVKIFPTEMSVLGGRVSSLRRKQTDVAEAP